MQFPSFRHPTQNPGCIYLLHAPTTCYAYLVLLNKQHYITLCKSTTSTILIGHYFSVALRPSAGHGLLILDVSRSHTTTHHSR